MITLIISPINTLMSMMLCMDGVLYIIGLTEFGDVGEGGGASVDKTLNQ